MSQTSFIESNSGKFGILLVDQPILLFSQV